MGEIAAIGWLVAAFFAVAYWLHRTECGKAVENLIRQREEYRHALDEFRKGIVARRTERKQEVAAPKRPPVLNSAAARARNDKSNAPYFSAEKRIPNSEVLKEQEHG